MVRLWKQGTGNVTVLAVVMARGGSKSIPKKNIAIAGGRPLIAWTCMAARSARCISRLTVSTDLPEIGIVAQTWGAEFAFLRPLELSQDDSPPVPGLLQALDWAEADSGHAFDFVLLLQPTSPLRTGDDIDEAFRLALSNQADSVVSVTAARPHPYLTKRVTSEGLLVDFGDWPANYRRKQSLPDAYALNGAIYLVSRKLLVEQGALYGDRTLAYVMPAERSLDIDDEWDLKLADLILSQPDSWPA